MDGERSPSGCHYALGNALHLHDWLAEERLKSFTCVQLASQMVHFIQAWYCAQQDTQPIRDSKYGVIRQILDTSIQPMIWTNVVECPYGRQHVDFENQGNLSDDKQYTEVVKQ
jgi:hypothetical protein